jgi:hypothetical protein
MLSKQPVVDAAPVPITMIVKSPMTSARIRMKRAYGRQPAPAADTG